MGQAKWQRGLCQNIDIADLEFELNYTENESIVYLETLTNQILIVKLG